MADRKIAGLYIDGSGIERVKTAVGFAVAEAVRTGSAPTDAKVREMTNAVLKARRLVQQEVNRIATTGGIVLGNNDRLQITEGSNGTVSVKLASQPTATVTVTPSVRGNSDVTVSGALTFTTSNWNTAKNVTVSVAEDSDSDADYATLDLVCTGGGYDNVIAEIFVSVADND